MSDPYARLGVRRRINAAGALTRLGGAVMAPEVVDAMAAASQASVDIGELQDAASARIARATGAEAGLVTTGAAAALTLAAAASIARWDVAKMATLPHGDSPRASHRLCAFSCGIRRAADRYRSQRPRHGCWRARARSVGDRGGSVACR